MRARSKKYWIRESNKLCLSKGAKEQSVLQQWSRLTTFQGRGDTFISHGCTPSFIIHGCSNLLSTLLPTYKYTLKLQISWGNSDFIELCQGDQNWLMDLSKVIKYFHLHVQLIFCSISEFLYPYKSPLNQRTSISETPCFFPFTPTLIVLEIFRTWINPYLLLLKSKT